MTRNKIEQEINPQKEMGKQEKTQDKVRAAHLRRKSQEMRKKEMWQQTRLSAITIAEMWGRKNSLKY